MFGLGKRQHGIGREDLLEAIHETVTDAVAAEMKRLDDKWEKRRERQQATFSDNHAELEVRRPGKPRRR